MKKTILLSLVILISFSSKAYLKVTNNTSRQGFTFRVICHDATYTGCGALESQDFYISSYSTMTFANTSLLGYSYNIGLGGYVIPGNTQNWDAFMFYYNDGGYYHPGWVGVGTCGSYNSVFDDPSHGICSGSFKAEITTSGSNTFVTLADY